MADGGINPGVRAKRCDFNGWHWVYANIAHAQTFEATGSRISSLKLRVAKLNDNKPSAPLEVEIRDPKFEIIYARGFIDAKVAQREFRWQQVELTHTSPLKTGGSYALLFHSRDNTNQSPWVVNAIYEDVYPPGRHGSNGHEDFFFAIDFKDGKSLRVGPDGEKTRMTTPISSGSAGGLPGDGGPLTLQGFGPIPTGRLNGTTQPTK